MHPIHIKKCNFQHLPVAVVVDEVSVLAVMVSTVDGLLRFLGLFLGVESGSKLRELESL